MDRDGFKLSSRSISPLCFPAARFKTIIKVEAGSKTGGGRKAIAMTFRRYGLGIKVSSDGEIAGFNQTGQTQEPLFAFE
jgi:hypothetical protein